MASVFFFYPAITSAPYAVLNILVSVKVGQSPGLIHMSNLKIVVPLVGQGVGFVTDIGKVANGGFSVSNS
jgi:hypothetical protein